jgi:phage major head subunit gpT-like protein
MNRSTFAKSVVPGLFAFAVDSFKERPELWRELCTVKPSRRAYEESAYYAGFGYVPVKPEGEPIVYDELTQGATKRWSHITYGLGCRITEELIDDSLYPDVGQMESIARELGRSARETLEVLVADIWNNGTATTNHTAGDALAVFSNSHVGLRSSTWSNLLTPSADLSAASLEAAIDALETTKDGSGKNQMIKAVTLLVPTRLAWKAKELLNSGYDPESPNNAINALKERNLKLIVSPYYTDTDAWGLIADQNPLIAFLRRKVTFAKDGDFNTGDYLQKVTFRFSVEVNNPLGLYWSAGA